MLLSVFLHVGGKFFLLKSHPRGLVFVGEFGHSQQFLGLLETSSCLRLVGHHAISVAERKMLEFLFLRWFLGYD